MRKIISLMIALLSLFALTAFSLQACTQNTTYSEGEEPNRRVVIMLAGQSEASAKHERSERAERGDKPSSSRRSRSRRRGRRGVKNAAPQGGQENAIVQDAPQAAQTVDVLGGEE